MGIENPCANSGRQPAKPECDCCCWEHCAHAAGFCVGVAEDETERECLGHPAGTNGPIGQATYSDGSCRKAEGSR